MKIILLALFLLPCFLFAQLSRSSRDPHVDKNTCYPGDTIRFSSYSYRDKETNLYVDLYADDSISVGQHTFPIINNKANGSIVIPKQSGYYWLRSYTYNSQVFIMPLSVLDDSIKMFANRRLVNTSSNQPVAPKVTLTKEQDSLSVSIDDSFPTPLSLSVTDANLPGPSYTLIPSNTDFENPDADYLSYSGMVRTNNRKQKVVHDKELVFVFQQDSATKILTAPIDSTGAFKISGLFFHDTASLNYQLNAEAGKITDVAISFQSKQYPLLTIPTDYLNDTITYTPKAIVTDFKDRVGYLKTAVVKTRWADRNKALDHRYVKDLKFTWPSQFNFDLRDTVATKYTFDLIDYLHRELPFFDVSITRDSAPKFKKKNIDFYLDEQPMSWDFLNSLLNVHTDIAYVKVIEDIDPDRPIIAVYRRDAKDLRSVPGKLGRIPILGYATPAPFTQPDRITSLWIPSLTGNKFKIRNCTGRLVIEGLIV